MAIGLGPHDVRIVPLGGLGEIGMNCLAIEQDDGIVVIDCGSLFPYDDRGIELYHPDITWIRQRADRLLGVFLTHGHEDHIGGLPFLLAQVRAPVYGSPHALGLAQRRIADRGFDPSGVEFIEAECGRNHCLGPFEIEPVRVSHSIVEATALALHTRAGTVVHSGDFNFDPNPPDGEPTDVERLRQLGDDGVELLLSDSTNIDVPDRPGSERSVGDALAELVGQASERVVISLFASNIQRLMLLGEIARSTGRKVCLFGRSLNTQVDVARSTGRLEWPSDLCIGSERAASWPRRQLLVLAGGTQAEQNSAMARLARGQHRDLSLEEGDTVIFSSRIIPGNERPVFEMFGDLLRRGVQLHTRVTDPRVHTSGHAGRSEQQRMIELVRPNRFIPIHGTMHHMRRHADLAGRLGLQVLVTENGTPVRVGPADFRVDEPVPCGRVAVSSDGTELSSELLKRRSELGRTGVVFVSVVLDPKGLLLGAPEVSARGVAGVDEDTDALRFIARQVAWLFQNSRTNGDFTDDVRRAVRRAVAEISGFRPLVEVQVHRI